MNKRVGKVVLERQEYEFKFDIEKTTVTFDAF